MLQALGTELRMVLPTSIGFERYQLPISYAIKFKFKSPFPRNNPFKIDKLSSVSSVGWPGSK